MAVCRNTRVDSDDELGLGWAEQILGGAKKARHRKFETEPYHNQIRITKAAERPSPAGLWIQIAFYPKGTTLSISQQAMAPKSSYSLNGKEQLSSR